MTGPEQLFQAEIADPKATQRSLAVCYAILIAAHVRRGEEFWRPINEALNAKIGAPDVANDAHRRKIDRFRKLAWSIHDAAAKVGKEPANVG